MLVEQLEQIKSTPIGARTKVERNKLLKIEKKIDRMISHNHPYTQLSRQLIADDNLTFTGSGTDQFALYTETSTSGIWMTSIEIQNFRALSFLQITFPDSFTDTAEEPWVMLLGENGLGKSSVLKAIALPYIVASGRAAEVLDPLACVYDKARPARGHVRISFSNGHEVMVKFGSKIDGFEMSGSMPDIPLLGYGATRLTPPSNHKESTVPAKIRLENLFDPRAPLTDAEPWLTDTKRISSKKFNNLSSALLTLMAAGDNSTIERKMGRLYMRVGNSRVPLRDMSDGYQSVVALAADIMVNLAGDWDNMSSAEGTVLLDEIEVHLHPKWKMEIVSSLRQVFPRVRFVVTTHDPLCLHDLNEGELHRLFRDTSTQAINVIQLDVPKGLRADQLLTGAWFGLTSTLDEDTRDLFQEYTDLLRQESTPNNQLEIRRLQRELKNRTGGIGETSIERVALGVVADLVDEESQSRDWNPKEARNSILARMRSIRSSSKKT